FHMNIMAAGIVNAMDAGKYLQLARPVGSSHESLPYRAVFIRDHQEIQQPGPTYIFTSWNRTNEQTKDMKKCKTLAKFMSMEVSIDRTTTGGPTILRSMRWINGLCFFHGDERVPFVFPWPESL
ncbi:hypothetical protein K491DRAFT_580240, partial [Lophiostoma macrostomum CBS 122681]